VYSFFETMTLKLLWITLRDGWNFVSWSFKFVKGRYVVDPNCVVFLTFDGAANAPKHHYADGGYRSHRNETVNVQIFQLTF
jgi:hypothetical protein